MYDQLLDTSRKAAEATVQIQQELFRQWALQWARPVGFPDPTVALSGMADRARALQQQWADTVIRALEQHRETLDDQYKAGIRTIEDAFRVGQARDPEQFRQFLEELWKHSFEALKSVTEAQMGRFQAALHDWSEAVAKGMAAAKV
jgi:hypothetical protein